MRALSIHLKSVSIFGFFWSIVSGGKFRKLLKNVVISLPWFNSSYFVLNIRTMQWGNFLAIKLFIWNDNVVILYMWSV